MTEKGWAVFNVFVVAPMTMNILNKSTNVYCQECEIDMNKKVHQGVLTFPMMYNQLNFAASQI